ncbi:SMc00767 family acetate metabolism repressor [Pseudoroseicyclus sp. H15]
MINSPDFERIDRPESDAQTRAIHRVADSVHRLNEAVQRAVAEGISVELIRVSRHHSGKGAWGDQLVPTVRETAKATTAA